MIVLKCSGCKLNERRKGHCLFICLLITEELKGRMCPAGGSFSVMEGGVCKKKKKNRAIYTGFSFKCAFC